MHDWNRALPLRPGFSGTLDERLLPERRIPILHQPPSFTSAGLMWSAGLHPERRIPILHQNGSRFRFVEAPNARLESCAPRTALLASLRRSMHDWNRALRGRPCWLRRGVRCTIGIVRSPVGAARFVGACDARLESCAPRSPLLASLGREVHDWNRALPGRPCSLRWGVRCTIGIVRSAVGPARFVGACDARLNRALPLRPGFSGTLNERSLLERRIPILH